MLYSLVHIEHAFTAVLLYREISSSCLLIFYKCAVSSWVNWTLVKVLSTLAALWHSASWPSTWLPSTCSGCTRKMSSRIFLIVVHSVSDGRRMDAVVLFVRQWVGFSVTSSLVLLEFMYTTVTQYSLFPSRFVSSICIPHCSLSYSRYTCYSFLIWPPMHAEVTIMTQCPWGPTLVGLHSR